MSGALKRDEWETVRLGDVCDVVSGSTPKTANLEYWDGDILWITPAELNEDSHYIYDTTRKITEAGRNSASLTLLPKGTVLLSSRAPIGKVGIVGTEMCCNQGFKNLVCSPVIFNNYLFWFLKGKTDYLNSLGRGATFKEISKGIVESIQIPLPPLDIQRQIADTLDKVTELITLRKTQLKKLDELVKARFVEMFGDYDLSHTQSDWKPISEIGKVVGGATPKTNIEEYWDGEYRWITPAELSADSGYIYDSVRKLTKAGVDSCSLQEMPINTVILSSRAPIGKVAIAGNTLYCNQGFKNIICNKEIIPRYLYTVLLLNTEYLNSLGRGATFKEISKSIVENIRIPVPPIKLQEQFATFVEQTDKSKVIIQQSLDTLETLKKSLMQEYFG